MAHTIHGLSIGIDRVDNHIFLRMTAVGKLTHEDYERITPVIDGALAEVKDADVKVLLDVTEFDGWELRAAWDDFQIARKHGHVFDQVAIVGRSQWQEWASKVAGWFVSGEVRYFEDMPEALAWLMQG